MPLLALVLLADRLNCITNGIPVVLQTRRQVDLCASRIDSGLAFFVENGIITREKAEEARKLATITTSIQEAVTDAIMVQESGPDSIELKHQLIEQIETYAPADAIIASSTSTP